MATTADAAAAATAPATKLYCTDGDDCPCHTAEKSRVPINPGEKSSKVTLAPGETKYACMCGQSKNFPWCDGAHKAYNEANGTSIGPAVVKNEGEEPKDVYMCMCGHSKNRPFCDGTHRKLHAAGEPAKK